MDPEPFNAVTIITDALGQMTGALTVIIPAALAIGVTVWITTRGWSTAKKVGK